MKKKYDAILFDLGNVVLRIHFNKCFEHWAKASNKNVEDVSKYFAFDDAYAAHEVAKISGEQYHAHICKLLNATFSYEDFKLGWNAIFGDVVVETEELLRELKNRHKLYALTNSNVLHRKVWSTRYANVLKNFDEIFCSSQIGYRKPDHKSFEHVCEKIGVQPDRFLFIDDLLQNVEGAETFGMNAILFTDPKETISLIRKKLAI